MNKVKHLFCCWQLVIYKTLILTLSILMLVLLTLLAPISRTDGFNKITDRWYKLLKYDDLFDEWW